MYKFQFFLLHFPSRNAISSKQFNKFATTFFLLKDMEGGYCTWKFQLHRHFGFAIATLQIFHNPENVKISIFPFISAGTVWREKLKFLHFPDVGKFVTLLLQNQNSVQLKFSTSKATFLVFQSKKAFENPLNTFEDMAFLLGQCKGENWDFDIFWIVENL